MIGPYPVLRRQGNSPLPGPSMQVSEPGRPASLILLKSKRHPDSQVTGLPLSLEGTEKPHDLLLPQRPSLVQQGQDRRLGLCRDGHLNRLVKGWILVLLTLPGLDQGKNVSWRKQGLNRWKGGPSQSEDRA